MDNDALVAEVLALVGHPPSRYIEVQSRAWETWVRLASAAICGAAVATGEHTPPVVPCASHKELAERISEG